MNTKIKNVASQLVINIVIGFFSLICLVPFVLTLIISISSEDSVFNKGYSFFPSAFSIDGYRVIFADSSIYKAYAVSIIVTVVGTFFGLMFTSMAAYILSVKKVKFRGIMSIYFWIPMVFNAGLVPWYLVVTKVLSLKNNLLGLILPIMISPLFIFLSKSYYSTLPPSLSESAEIDGASPFRIFTTIVLPISTPIIATISLFISLGYWNDWYLSLWLIDKQDMYPLQYLLFRINSTISYLQSRNNQGIGGVIKIPTQTTQMATLFVTVGPIIFVYPFIQKYFVKGIMMGAIKG